MPRRVKPNIGAQMDHHVGMRIRSRRQHVGITAASLAKELDVSRQTVDKWENGLVRISVGQLFEAASVLQINPGWFFEGLPGSKVYDYRAAELDLALQIPDAVAVLMHYSRLDETQRAAALVLMESAGRGQPQTIDGKGSPLEMPQETDDAGDDEDADMADADA